MEAAEGDVLTHMAFPKEHRPQIASADPLERANGEAKRRTDDVGIFPNAGAIVTLAGAPLPEQHDEGAVSRRNMTLETLAETGDTALIGSTAPPA